MIKKLIPLASILLLALVIVPGTVSAQSACHLYESGTQAPQGFGQAWNTLVSSRDLLIRASCAGDRAQITVGTGAQNQYIYKDFYRWNGSAWLSRTWSGANLVGNAWYVGDAFGELDSTSDVDFFVAYVCQWTGTQWKCGCRDSSCTTSYWQLQAFDPSHVAQSGGSNSGGTGGTGDSGGGKLVYSWSPKLEWTQLPLSQRDYKDIVGDTKWWRDGANVGGSMVKNVKPTGSGQIATFNRAPTGEPSLEIFSPKGVHSAADFVVQLYEHYKGTPRHLRATVEYRLSDPKDPTTYKSNGVGTKSGSYPNWGLSSANDVQGKFILGMYAGNGSSGGCRTNWWNNSTFSIDRAGYRAVWASGGRGINNYAYVYDRASQCGAQGDPESGVYSKTNIDKTTGQWNRLEMEVFLTTPSKVPSNARLGAGEPSHTGDGFVKLYFTPDIDGEKGTPGKRELLANLDNLIFFPRDKDRHINANLAGPWINVYYGGSPVSTGEGWIWIRKLEVYEY